uniref:Protein kinase domain-containing protein n=1 Tax=Heterorhabditis bacteriophora TaxID=37862 RepID=A0A1I7X0U2_HETBA
MFQLSPEQEIVRNSIRTSLTPTRRSHDFKKILQKFQTADRSAQVQRGFTVDIKHRTLPSNEISSVLPPKNVWSSVRIESAPDEVKSLICTKSASKEILFAVSMDSASNSPRDNPLTTSPSAFSRLSMCSMHSPISFLPTRETSILCTSSPSFIPPPIRTIYSPEIDVNGASRSHTPLSHTSSSPELVPQSTLTINVPSSKRRSLPERWVKETDIDNSLSLPMSPFGSSSTGEFSSDDRTLLGLGFCYNFVLSQLDLSLFRPSGSLPVFNPLFTSQTPISLFLISSVKVNPLQNEIVTPAISIAFQSSRIQESTVRKKTVLRKEDKCNYDATKMVIHSTQSAPISKIVSVERFPLNPTPATQNRYGGSCRRVLTSLQGTNGNANGAHALQNRFKDKKNIAEINSCRTKSEGPRSNHSIPVFMSNENMLSRSSSNIDKNHVYEEVYKQYQQISLCHVYTLSIVADRLSNELRPGLPDYPVTLMIAPCSQYAPIMRRGDSHLFSLPSFLEIEDHDGTIDRFLHKTGARSLNGRNTKVYKSFFSPTYSITPYLSSCVLVFTAKLRSSFSRALRACAVLLQEDKSSSLTRAKNVLELALWWDGEPFKNEADVRLWIDVARAEGVDNMVIHQKLSIENCSKHSSESK